MSEIPPSEVVYRETLLDSLRKLNNRQVKAVKPFLEPVIKALEGIDLGKDPLPKLFAAVHGIGDPLTYEDPLGPEPVSEPVEIFAVRFTKDKIYYDLKAQGDGQFFDNIDPGVLK